MVDGSGTDSSIGWYAHWVLYPTISSVTVKCVDNSTMYCIAVGY